MEWASGSGAAPPFVGNFRTLVSGSIYPIVEHLFKKIVSRKAFQERRFKKIVSKKPSRKAFQKVL